MKQFNLFLAAVAAFSISMQAQEVRYGTIEVGDYTNATEFYNGSYFDMAPTNFYLAHTGAQMIYTPDLLGDLQGHLPHLIKKVARVMTLRPPQSLTH